VYVTDLDARYGRHRRTTPRWVWIVVATVGIALGVAWAAWSAWDDVPTHQARVLAYEVVDEQTTRVELEIFREEPVALTCRVYSQAQDKAVVGERTIEVPASEEYRTVVEARIRTERRAVTAVLDSCSVG